MQLNICNLKIYGAMPFGKLFPHVWINILSKLLFIKYFRLYSTKLKQFEDIL